jgi:hypothetical protein
MSAKPSNEPETPRASTVSAAVPGDRAPAPDAAGKPAVPGKATNDLAAQDQGPLWRQDDGAPVSCLEKIKVLNENYAELRQVAQDAFEDALLMGCSEAQIRDVLRELIDALDNPYRNAKQRPEER